MLLNKKEPAFAGSFGDVQLQNVIEYLQFVMINSPDDAGTQGSRYALALGQHHVLALREVQSPVAVNGWAAVPSLPNPSCG